MLFGVLLALPMAARDFSYTYEGQTLTYTVLDENAKTVQTRAGGYPNPGNDVSGDLVIPSVVTDGNVEYTVIKIGEWCFWNRTGLTSVTLPETLTTIGGRGFDTCTALTEITIPNSVKSIGDYAFVKCSGLTKLTIPNSVTSIGGSAFNECSNLTELTIPESVTSVGGSAFANCNALETVYFNAEYCTSNYGFPTTLKNIYFGENVKTISDNAFLNNSGLTSVTIPNSVTSIGVKAFYECPNLKSVTFGESLKTIGVDAFRLCRALTSVVIPNSVETMGRDIFVDCSGLTSVTIGKSLSSMGVNVFYRCNNIKYFVILSEHIVYNPEGLSQAFTMYVPASKLEEYKQTFSTNTKVTIIPLSNFEPEGTEETFSIGPNESKSLAMNLVGATAVTAFQTDITLPAGLAIAETDGNLDVTLGDGKTDTHVVAAAQVAGENTYRIIVYSTKNEPFTDGTNLLNIKLKANPISRSGDSVSNITLGNTLVALTGDQGVSPEDVTIPVEVTSGTTTGVESVTPDDLVENTDIYNLQGICLKRNATADDIRTLAPGLYIIGDKKVMVK